MIVSGEQRAEWFALAGEKLGATYAHALGHKLITVMGQAGEPLAFAVLTNVVPKQRAELTVWISSRRGLGGNEFLRAIFKTVFQQWACRRLTACVRVSNVASQRAVLSLGFTFETTLLRWFGNEDGLCFYMLPEQCRWLKE